MNTPPPNTPPPTPQSFTPRLGKQATTRCRTGRARAIRRTATTASGVLRRSRFARAKSRAVPPTARSVVVGGEGRREGVIVIDGIVCATCSTTFLQGTILLRPFVSMGCRLMYSPSISTRLQTSVPFERLSMLPIRIRLELLSLESGSAELEETSTHYNCTVCNRPIELTDFGPVKHRKKWGDG